MKIRHENGINTLTISSRRNNAIDDNFLNEFDRLIQTTNTSFPLVIEGDGGYFCPGIDLIYTLDMNREEMMEYIIRFDRMLLSVLSYPSTTYAYINGHAIAGGFALALASDYRIAHGGNYLVGYNRDRIGIDLPPVARFLYDRYISRKKEISGLHKIEDFLESDIIDHKISINMLPVDKIKSESKRFKDLFSKASDILTRERQEFVDSWYRDDVASYRKGVVSKMSESELDN